MKVGDLVRWQHLGGKPDEFGIVASVDEKLGFFKLVGYPDNQLFAMTRWNLEVVNE